MKQLRKEKRKKEKKKKSFSDLICLNLTGYVKNNLKDYVDNLVIHC